MRSHRRVAPLVASLIILLLVAAACGGDSDENAEEAVDTAEEGLAETEAPAATDAPAGTEAPSGGDYDAALAELVAAAQEEGECTIYSSQALDNLNNLADAFNDEYGIDVTVVRGTDGDNNPRLETEFATDTAGADFAVGASKGWVVDNVENFLDPTASPQLAGLGDYDSAQFLDDNYFEVGAALLTFAWNTDLVPEGLNDLEDLLDPELGGGKIGVIDPAIAPAVVDFWLWLEDTYGEDFVEALAAQEPRIYGSALPIGEALISGEIFAAPYAAPVQIVPAAADGAPVDFGISDRGAWGAKYFGFIPRTAANPACGTLLADFMVTARGQELVMGVAGTVVPTESSLINNDMVRDQDLEATAPEPAAAYVEKWDSLFR